MGEHFIVDNSTTPDWEVMPLGPVDMDLPPFRQAVAMLADSWNSR